MLDDLIEAVVFVVSICITIAVCLVIIVFGGWTISEPFSNRDCRIYGEMTGIKTEYRWFNNCYVQLNNKMIPMSEYLDRDIQKKAQVEVK